MICIYHSRDFDGMASGAIVKKRFRDVTLFPWDYGQPIPEFPEEIPLIMCDVSFPKEEMERIKNRLIWIDHHKSAIAENDPHIKGLRDSNFAACELTWKFCYSDKPMPYIIEQLGKYDSWRKDEDWDDIVMPIQMAMKAYSTSAETFPEWALKTTGQFDDLIESGKLMLSAKKNMDIIKCRTTFTATIDGYRAICLNAGAGSQVYDSVYDPEKHDIMCSFIFNGTKWTISFYSHKDIDCSLIATKRGGGGHKGAAGCTLTTNELQELLKL